jgi:hypothetical protein
MLGFVEKLKRLRTVTPYIYLLAICFSTSAITFAQPFSLKGQFWGNILHGNDPPANHSSFVTDLGYIPMLSLSRDLSIDRFVDLEWGYRMHYRMHEEDIAFSSNPYRLWLRYSSEKIEARLGLQKIAFGPAMVLRSLAWFDTIDPRDPTGQTDAVEALRLRVFPTSSLAIWLWSINNDQDTLSYGGRAELSTSIGEWGLTYHQDPAELGQSVGQFPNFISGPHQRVAVDYRFDGYFGFWFEGAGIFSDSKQDVELNGFTQFTLGADYTIPVGPGLLIMAETMKINSISTEKYSSTEQTYTALMASLPINMLHQLMFISQIDWDNSYMYNYLRWGITYDHFSLNFILSISPKRGDYEIAKEDLPKTVAGFGTGIQFMLIYNH